MVKGLKTMAALCSLLLLFILSGCAGPPWETAGRIVPPQSGNGPLAGTWAIDQEFGTGLNTGQNTGQNSRLNTLTPAAQTWIGKTAQFSQEAAIIGEYSWPHPVFKVKKVNTQEYLLSKYLTLPGDLAVRDKEVYVVTLSNADNFLGEFLRLDDARVLAFVQNKVLLLTKTSSMVDASLASAVAAQDAAAEDEAAEPGKAVKSAGAAGVLLGLKTPSPEAGQKASAYTYRTLWLAATNRHLHPILEDKDIFFPRLSGFWKLKVRRVEEGTKAEDLLLAYDVSTKDPEAMPEELKPVLGSLFWEGREGVLARSLNFVGNDFVSFENSGSGVFDSRGVLGESGHSWFDNSFQVNPIDNLETRQGITLSDLAGERGTAAFSNASAQVLRALEQRPDLETGSSDQGQNWGLVRKNGHWLLQGRLSYQSGGKPGYLDYNINLVPPSKLVSFDTLSLSWQTIKERVPDAVDAFTSPNRSLAVVATRTRLYVYAMNEGRLGSEPLAKLDLHEGETVVMAEWATGLYVDNWEQSFRANGAK
ncbi:hypothetical protein [Paradesulfitobacterium ferrireducens]|uniref:hypothetical protein n=1 Tax=Paradesulfitobacterium ferrireducens TaxID=2816476 RepID=UPI001A8E488D|nr:hypothetical protein [Paradesulfitobacterium ferrireducens]